MASTIVARTVGAIADQRASLQNSNFGRKYFIGSGSWTTIRIGIRFILSSHGFVNGSTITGTPRFGIGLSSGTTNMFQDNTTTHWFGILTDTANWTYTRTNVNFPSWAVLGSPVIAKRVGTTLTKGNAFLGAFDHFLPSDETGTTAYRRMILVDITKGSPNYSISALLNYGTGLGIFDVTDSAFLQQMELTTPGSGGADYIGPKTLAVDEGVDGTFDTVNIAWGLSNPTLEICDLAVSRIA